MILKIDYDTVKLQKVTYDYFLMSQTATENTSSKFSMFKPLP